MVAERVVLSYKDDMVVQIVRPASICGYSPRMRLETTVNQYTIQALETGNINVYGGSQMHPNAHIDDVVDLYIYLLDHPEHTGIYNSITYNHTKLNIAEQVARTVDAGIVIHETTDTRSYRMDDDKVRSIGFHPKYNVRDAIAGLVLEYRAGRLKNEDRWYNLKSMLR